MLKRLCVALRKESVDRNINNPQIDKHDGMSLSARRAWIEIHNAGILRPWVCVALRKERVDRNVAKQADAAAAFGRSPQGERG